LYTVANENKNEKNPDIQMVVADTRDKKRYINFHLFVFQGTLSISYPKYILILVCAFEYTMIRR
jgi:hypothetical protein